MIGKPFINEILSKAIENYLKYKEKPNDPIFTSFPVMVIRTLIYIYGELDIINPYITQNEHNMGGFDNNLTKYGFPLNELEEFKSQFIIFEKELNNLPNTGFINIEKYLIKMYFYKQKVMNIPREQQQEFKTYLYLYDNPNELIKKDIERWCIDKNELSIYFQSIAHEFMHNYRLEEVRRNMLLKEAYTLLGYQMEQLNMLSDSDLRNVNQQVYQFFRVDQNLNDKDELLQKAVNYYKKYGNKITSGNGYVDFLLFVSILATATLIASLVLFL